MSNNDNFTRLDAARPKWSGVAASLVCGCGATVQVSDVPTRCGCGRVYVIRWDVYVAETKGDT